MPGRSAVDRLPWASSPGARVLLGCLACGGLLLCTGCDALAGAVQGARAWWSAEGERREGVSGLLLTLAQVNATILAFLLGLGLITSQLASRFALPKLRVDRRDRFFLGVYALVGVFVPLVVSLTPSVLVAVIVVLVSLAFVVLAPARAERAIRAGHPFELARAALRIAGRPRLRPHRHARRLGLAHQSLVALRQDATSRAVADLAQDYLLRVLLVALDSGERQQAQRIARSVVGDIDPGVEDRLRILRAWLRTQADVLVQVPDAGRAAWDALADVCRRSPDEQPEVTVLAVACATTLATARVRFASTTAPTVRVTNDYGAERVGLALDTSGDVRQVLEEVSGLVPLLAEKTSARQRGRALFAATCELLVGPVRELRLGADLPLSVPFASAEPLFASLAGRLASGAPEDAEARARMTLLIEIPFGLLETAQEHGFLNTSAGRHVLRGYLRWIEHAAANGSSWLVQALTSALQRRVRARFVVRQSYRSTRASTIQTSGVLAGVADELAAAAAGLQRRWVEAEGWGSGVYEHFDVVSWGRDEQMAPLARELLPALDAVLHRSEGPVDPQEEFWQTRLRREARTRCVEQWLRTGVRPDVLLGVLLGRWGRAAAENYRGPAPTADETVPAYVLESARIRQEARDSLARASRLVPRSPGAAAQTVAGWARASVSWLQQTEDREGSADVVGLLAGVDALPGTPERLAADLRAPTSTDRQGRVTDGDVWSAVFGYAWPGSWAPDPLTAARSDLPARTYCLLPQWEGGSHGYVAALEDDDSVRLLVLERRDGSCEETVPFSSGYLPDVLLEDCLGVLAACTTCFGLARAGGFTTVTCPVCCGSGRLAVYERLREAAFDFVARLPPHGQAPERPTTRSRRSRAEDWGGRIRVFTSTELRSHLADRLVDMSDDSEM